MLTHKISLDHAAASQILGSNDRHLKRIAGAFENAEISARGSQINIRGELDDIRLLEKIFNELTFIAGKHGEVTEKDLSTVLDLVSVGKSVSRDDIDNVLLFTRNEPVRAKTEGQKRYVKLVQKNDIVFCIGPAGTGKSFLAVAMAVAALKNRDVSRIVLARPAVEAGESLGFLPGDMREKVDPYLKPLYDALNDMLSAEKVKEHIDKGVIEIAPLAFMRGRTLNNAFIILDEAQNTTPTQLKMFLTRLGMNSKAIITGDISQIDLVNPEMSGLVRIQSILKGIEGVGFIYLDKADVVRHRLVREIIDAYEKYELQSPATDSSSKTARKRR
ncbi:MAG: PhoH family protein [Bacteroidetes bacterium]|nr:PhoH family protein [Bacteroidota bacterium]